MKEKIANAGTVVSAFLASLCCIGPIVFAALGLGGIGFMVSLEAYRPWFMGFTILFLAGAFYYTYRKREVACEDGSCKTESGSKWSKISLWTITVLAIFFMVFPYINWSSNTIAVEQSGFGEFTQITIPVEGMTCNSCNTAVEMAVGKLDGVKNVQADFQTKKAVVKYDESKVSVNQITEAIDYLGYRAGNISYSN
jgi:copper ion binding protein